MSKNQKFIPTVKVTELTKYIQLITDLHVFSKITPTKTLWFRGQSDRCWKLIPTIYRNKNLNYFEREMIRDFKLLSGELINKKPTNELEWLFLMQHYGLQTRLLDWTESHLVALFFAVVDYSSVIDGAVWILRPSYLNLASLGDRTITTSANPELIKYTLDEPHIKDRKIKGYLPVAIRPLRNSARIVAQKGTFTIHGNCPKTLNEIIREHNAKGKDEILLECIIIDGKSKLKILKELYLAGISYSVVFPEIQGLCNEIRVKYSDEFTFKADLSKLV